MWGFRNSRESLPAHPDPASAPSRNLILTHYFALDRSHDAEMSNFRYRHCSTMRLPKLMTKQSQLCYTLMLTRRGRCDTPNTHCHTLVTNVTIINFNSIFSVCVCSFGVIYIEYDIMDVLLWTLIVCHGRWDWAWRDWAGLIRIFHNGVAEHPNIDWEWLGNFLWPSSVRPVGPPTYSWRDLL